MPKKHNKQDYVAHVLNKDGDGPAENRSSYNGKKGNRGAHSMHQIRCVPEGHATENCAEVDCCLNISYFLAIELKRVVRTS